MPTIRYLGGGNYLHQYGWGYIMYVPVSYTYDPVPTRLVWGYRTHNITGCSHQVVGL